MATAERLAVYLRFKTKLKELLENFVTLAWAQRFTDTRDVRDRYTRLLTICAIIGAFYKRLGAAISKPN